MNLFNNSSTSVPRHEPGFLIMMLLMLEGFLVVLINALVIFLIIRRRPLQTVTNLCLGSLALSDMLTGLYVIPFIIKCNYPVYDFGFCLAMDLGNRFLAISTILHLLVITMERYYTIVFSKSSSSSSLTIATAVRVLVILWGFSLTVSLVQLSWVFDQKELTDRIMVIYDLLVFCLLVCLPLVLMAMAYTHIFCVLRRQINKIQRCTRYVCEEITLKHNRKERKALLIYGAMIFVYITGWFNYFLYTLQNDLSENSFPVYPFWAHMVLLYLRLSTGIFNPILYTFLKQDFRTARKSLRLCLPRNADGLRSTSSRTKTSFFSSAFYKKDPESIDVLTGTC